MTKLNSLSLFFPAHNEEQSIRKSLESALRIAPKIAKNYEIIVVDDASTDGTARVVDEIAQKHEHIHLVSHDVNKGYGRAVKTGLETAQHDYVFFTDSDGQFDLEDLPRLTEHAQNYDIVIGYREARQDSFARLLNAKGWNFLNRMLFDLQVKDIDCAFKLMRRETVQSLTLFSDGAMVSAEMLIRLKRRGLAFKEIPVTHLPRMNGTATGAKPRVIARALREMGTLFLGDLGAETRRQLSVYALIGLINTGLDLSIYLLLTQVTGLFTGNEMLAKVISFLCGVVSSFVLNSSYTFSRHPVSNGLLPYLSVSMVGLMANAMAFTTVRMLGFGEITSVLLAAVVSFFVGFALVKTLVFVPHSR